MRNEENKKAENNLYSQLLTSCVGITISGYSPWNVYSFISEVYSTIFITAHDYQGKSSEQRKLDFLENEAPNEQILFHAVNLHFLEGHLLYFPRATEHVSIL